MSRPLDPAQLALAAVLLALVADPSPVGDGPVARERPAATPSRRVAGRRSLRPPRAC